MIKLSRKSLGRILVYGVLGISVAFLTGMQVLLRYSPAPTVITCRGSSTEMGEHYGDELALATKMIIKGYLEQGVCRGDETLIARRYAVAGGVFKNLPKPYSDELKAISDSSGCDQNALMYGNSFLDLGNASAGCRSVVINSRGGVLHAHNLDWNDLAGLAKWTTTIIRREPSDGRLKTVTVAFPGMVGALDIINSKGVAMSFNQLGYGNSVPAEPVFIMMRRIAETCETFQEAEKEILNAPEGMPFLITLSSSTEGETAIYERLGSHVEKRSLRDGWVAGCNVAQKQETGQTLLDQTMISIQPDDIDSLKNVLKHPDVVAANNLYSVIFDFQNNTVFLASGSIPAAKGEFRKFPLF